MDIANDKIMYMFRSMYKTELLSVMRDRIIYPGQKKDGKNNERSNTN